MGGRCRRTMYYLTGLLGWMRFGYSPGWVGRSPTGLPPAAQYLVQTGQMPQFASWLFLLFSIVYTILSVVHTVPEERSCLEKYGDAYRDYMNRIPRWIGIPKSGKK